jgi:predicted extracellular nuclease
MLFKQRTHILLAFALALTVLLGSGIRANAAAPELFISEYIEGSSFNKAIEVYNGTGNAVDLAAGVYTLELYSNGSPTVSQSLVLSGIITDGDVYVLAHPSADPAILAQADETSGAVINFNGDDGVVLRKAGLVIDAFGQNGVDPGSQWDGGGQNDTLRRKDAVCEGDNNFGDPFDASAEWDVSAQNTFDGLGSHSVNCNGSGTATDPVINEFVANHTGTDTQAFVEVFGDPSTDYSAFTVLEIEGDSSGAGVIDAVLPVGTTSGDGYWTDLEDAENGTVTWLLVEDFSGSAGSDLDTDNDGTFDATPWTRLVDDVATTDGGGSDVTYSSTVLAAFFDGNPFGAGGASRIPNGTDTDATADWVRNDFDGFGFPGFPGSPAIGEAENTPGAVNIAITVATDPVGICNDPATLIHDIQGSGLASPDVGSIREIEGIVTGDFEGGTELSGFFMQEESAQFDGDGTTSEGIFVFNAGVGSINVGDTVRVRGSVAEFFGLTEINNVVSVTVCAPTGVTAPAPWSLPVGSVDDWEWVEGMEITINQPLYASGNFNQARFGEVDLSVGGPLDNPTNVVAPGAPAIALQDLNDRSRIQLEDASTVQNPLPLPPYIGAGGTLRTGDTIPSITGNVSFSFGTYELQPTQAVNFTRVNVRPGVPDVGGRIQVAAYNVLNYFTTLDNAGPICGPLSDQGCRGADNAFEFERQRAKLVDAISELDADVVGLMEIENYPGDVPTADLVAGLNAATAPGTYAYIVTGAVGTDAIRQAILYQPASLTPLGGFEVLDSNVDPTFNDDKNRPMLVQSFVENVTGAVFTVGVNHLKSKGSDCDDLGDPDTGDGQGNCNVTRTTAAQAIVNFLATDPTSSGDSDFLIIGDLNAYAQEDPIVTIETGGYTDLIETFQGTGFAAGAYSFNFFSQSGYLDHGLSSGTMTPQVTSAAFWHVNADEPRGLDYNDFNQPGLYNPDEFRSSDHDPVVIGLNLNTPMGLKETASLELSLLLPTGDKQDDHFIEKAIERIDQSLNPDWWVDGSTLDPKTGNHVFDREHQAVQELEKVTTVDVSAAIDQILEADKQLALKELITAILGGGNPDRIAKAQGNMADAADHVANGEFAKAILDYKKAWQNAIKAQ